MYRVFGISNIGRQRSHNEDCFIIDYMISRENSIYFEGEDLLAAVADGMGGAACGEFASNYVLKKFHQNLSKISKDNIADIINEINLDLFDEGRKIDETRGMGSTLTGIILNNENNIIFNVGDSRGYLYRNGSIVQLTKDQTLVQEFYEHGIIKKEQIKNHPRANILTQCMGGHKRESISPQIIPNNEFLIGDIILLCSDGLYNKLDENKLKDMLCKNEELQEIGNEMINEANRLGGDDNITVILIKKI